MAKGLIARGIVEALIFLDRSHDKKRKWLEKEGSILFSIDKKQGGFMAESKAVKELMIDAFEYPHMPYWFTIRQAVGIMKKAVIDAQKCMNPQVILVFDEKYNLIGTLTIRDILRGLVPCLLAQGSTENTPVTPAEEKAIADVEAGLSRAELKKLSEKPISEIMKPVSVSVSLEDSIGRAAFLMECKNIQVLPVLENNKKLVGIVRMIEVFQEVSRSLLEK